MSRDKIRRCYFKKQVKKLKKNFEFKIGKYKKIINFT